MSLKLYPLRILLLILVITSLSPGCKTDPKTSTETKAEDEKFTVVSRIRGEPDRLSPILTTRSWSLRVATKMIPSLAEYDPLTTELKPMLIKDVPREFVVEDGPYAGNTAYEMEFLDEAVWDNGQPITAADYIFSLKVIFNPKITVGVPVYRSYFGNIKDVVVDPDNPKKFVVYSKGKYTRAQYIVAAFYLYPEYHYDPKGLMKEVQLSDLANPDKAEKIAEENPGLEQFATQFLEDKYARTPGEVVGAGPYQLEEWQAGERIVLKKKENWWGDQLADKYTMLTAKPDRLVYKPIKDANAAIALAKSGGLDVLSRLPTDQFLQMKEDPAIAEQFYFLTPPTTTYNYIGVNTSQPILSDKKIRQALAYTVNTSEIIKTINQGMGQKIVSPIPPFRPNYNKDLEPYDLNVEKAKSLLAEAGWKDTNRNGIVDKKINGKQTELTLEMMTLAGIIVAEQTAIMMKADAKKAGINIELVPLEAKKMIGDRNKGNFDLFMLAAVPDMGVYDPRQSWHSESSYPSGSNYYGFGSQKTDALIAEINATLEPEAQQKLFYEFQEILHDEVPVIFLYNTTDRIMQSKKFKKMPEMIRSPNVFEEYFELK